MSQQCSVQVAAGTMGMLMRLRRPPGGSSTLLAVLVAFAMVLIVLAMVPSRALKAKAVRLAGADSASVAASPVAEVQEDAIITVQASNVSERMDVLLELQLNMPGKPPMRRSLQGHSKSKPIVLVAEAAESDANLSFFLPIYLPKTVRQVVAKDRTCMSTDEILSAYKELPDVVETPSTKEVFSASDKTSSPCGIRASAPDMSVLTAPHLGPDPSSRARLYDERMTRARMTRARGGGLLRV